MIGGRTLCTGGYITITCVHTTDYRTLHTAPYKPVVFTMMALLTDSQVPHRTKRDTNILTMCLEDFISHLSSPSLTITKL